MSTDCKVYLPANVRLNHVVEVIGVAVGCPVTKTPIGMDSYYVRVEGIGMENTIVPEMVQIRFGDRHCSYFFEGENDHVGPMISMKSTDFWIAVASRLVNFFGGHVDFNDCDEFDYDYQAAAKSNLSNRPTDGDDWKNLQDRIMNVPRIHKDELTAGLGAYEGNGDYEYHFDDEGFMIQK